MATRCSSSQTAAEYNPQNLCFIAILVAGLGVFSICLTILIKGNIFGSGVESSPILALSLIGKSSSAAQFCPIDNL